MDLLTSRHIAERPELSAIAILAAAIGAAEAALWHEHPELDWDPDPPGAPHPVGRNCHVAGSILILTLELRAEIRRYWAAASGDPITQPFAQALETGPAPDHDLQARLPF